MRELEEASGEGFAPLARRLAAVKDQVIGDLPRYVEEFRTHAEAAGATVVEAATASQACAYVEALCTERGTDLVVKSKTMVSEEVGLNEHLARAGITAVETDLGEWLLQLAGEQPSHLVMPAIHKRRHQIARLLEDALGRPFDPEDVMALVRAARTELRESFLRAGVGISGANALVAETGSVLLVTNEGNGRLVTSLPPIHVVLAGVEKTLPALRDAILQVRLLARSATGQAITTYTTLISGPTPGHELHIVLIDNGRSVMAADPDVASALRCIRCGACANVCPPYQVVGGHAFGHVYTGAIGLVITPFHHGLKAAAGPQSLCVSCGACATVCPVDIPLPSQILQIRRRVTKEFTPRRRLFLRAFASRRLVSVVTRLLALLTLPFRNGDVLNLRFPRRHLSWRLPPAIPFTPSRSRRTLRNAGEKTSGDGSPRRVMLFLQCLTDRLAPSIAVSTVALLRATGAEVLVPAAQHCCGLPAFDAGDWDTARRMARHTIEALEGESDVVTPAPSCLAAMIHDYPQLFADDPAWQARARRLAERTHDLTSYLSNPTRLADGSLLVGDPAPVTVDRFCQGANLLGRGDDVERLLTRLCGIEPVPLDEAEVCCGFGGSTSLVAPEVAAGILSRKLSRVAETGAKILISDNPGCVLHLRGGVGASGGEIQVLHVAEYLASRLGDAESSAWQQSQ
jgi:L-lactate dehydrogenase complex protein LldF